MVRIARRFGMSTVALASTLALGCTTGTADADGGGAGMDAGGDAGGGADAGPRTCTMDGECDDGFACTLDICVLGNVCDYEALDARCGDGERCVVGRGCVSGTPADCQRDADCDDGDACTGTETCAREMCIPGRPFSCADGNPCTTDVCDQTVAGMCRYELAPGCDAGGAAADAGPPCEPPSASDYERAYTMLPGAACDAGLGGSYAVDTVVFRVAGGALTAQAGPFTLTQTPAPSGAAFDLSGGNGCADVRLTGAFECAGRFRATWTSTHVGSCASACPDASQAVVGF